LSCQSRLGFSLFALPIVFALVFSVSPALALDPLKSLKQYRLDSWSGEGTLPQASAQSIYQTKDGYLWIGTMEGAVRFDGVRFSTFRKSNEPAFLFDDITSFLQSRDDSLWMGTWGGGLVRFHNGRFSAATQSTPLSESHVLCLGEETDGSLLVGTLAGLWRFRDGKATKIRRGGSADPLDGRVSELEPARQGGFWVGTDQGVVRVHNGKVQTGPGAPDSRVRALCEDRQGRLWIGRKDGLYCWDGSKFQPVDLGTGLVGKQVGTLIEDRDANIWAGLDRSGLFRIRDDLIERITTKEGLSDDDVISLAEDREGNVWVGTFRAGINRLKDGTVTAFDRSVGLSHDCVWSVFEDSRGVLWIGAEEGLNSMEGRGPVIQHPPFKDFCILGIAEASEGGLWVGTYEKGLAHYASGRVRWFGPADGLNLDRVYLLFRDGERVWVGGSPGGLYYLEKGRFRPADGKEKYLTAGSILKALDGSIWLGTDSGVTHLTDKGAQTWKAKDGLAGDKVLSLHQDSSGVLWIGTELGLTRFKDGQFTSFKVADGLPHCTITRVLEDDSGNLWLGSGKGIFRVSKKSLETYANGRLDSGSSDPGERRDRRGRLELKVYDKADGMKSSECNSGNPTTGWKRRDGSLWFPTIRGAVRIIPSELKANPVPPPVHVEEVTVDGRTLAMPVTRIPAGGRQFELRYTGLSLYSPAQVRFKYRLDGFDDEWVEPELGRDRIAHYTNLKPGEYTFRVMASNNDGVWSSSPASLKFVLLPSFYQTYWFYALCVIGLVGGGSGLYYVVSRMLASWRLTRKLTRYHSQKVLLEMRSRKSSLKRGLGSERRRITIFFSDIPGFAQLVEHLPAEQVTQLMNDYLSEMVPLVDTHGGVLTGFQGEGLMGFFGAPQPMDPAEQARRAVRMGVAMHDRMGELRDKWRDAGLPSDINIRIGIAQDYVTVGNFGSKDLMEYSAIGAGVNLASRLQSNCSPGKILVSFPVYIATRDEFSYGETVYREFKGFARRVRVAELEPRPVRAHEEEASGVAV